MIEGWRKKETAVDLYFGIYYHKALEEYDRLKLSWAHEESLAVIVDMLMTETWDHHTGKPWDSERTDKNRYTLIRSVIWYLDQFGPSDPAETVQLANGKPAVELSFKMELDWGPRSSLQIAPGETQPYLLCGHLDRIVNFLDGTYVMDHKTAKGSISSYYFERFEPDNQMSLYTLAAKVIFHTPVRGVIIDAACIQVGATQFARGFTYRTDSQLEEWLGDLRTHLAGAESCATSNHWPMNDTACFLCQFKKICSKDPSVRQNFLESEFTQEDPWNPIRPR
jgi:hypothetical protein